MKTTESTAALPIRFKVSGLTVYTRQGCQVARKSRNKGVSRQGTLEQMRQRVRFANCANLWHAFGRAAQPFYVMRRPQQNNYNSFMQYNLTRCNRYLDRELCEMGGNYPFEMQLTDGRLPAITLKLVDGLLVTSLHAGSLDIDAATTLGQIWDAVVNNNPGYYHYDIIGFFFIRLNDIDPEVPRMDCYAARFDMCQHDESATIGLNNAAIPLTQFFAVAEHDGTRKIAFRPLDGTRAHYNGLAVYHMRTDSLCSPSEVAYIRLGNEFASLEDLTHAVESYGSTSNPGYLEPDPDHTELATDFTNQ